MILRITLDDNRKKNQASRGLSAIADIFFKNSFSLFFSFLAISNQNNQKLTGYTKACNIGNHGII